VFVYLALLVPRGDFHRDFMAYTKICLTAVVLQEIIKANVTDEDVLSVSLSLASSEG